MPQQQQSKTVYLSTKTSHLIYRADLVRQANDMKADGLLSSVWTLDGKVFVKTSPSGNPVRIYSEDDLDEL